MKLVSCHHVRKRRRRLSAPPAWRATQEGVAVSPPSDPAGARHSRDEELLKMMLVSARQGGQLKRCDLAERRGESRSEKIARRAQDDDDLTTARKPSGAPCARGRANFDPGNRFKLFNRLMLYSTLLCLIVCNDSADKLAGWRRTGGLERETRPGGGLVRLASADSDANRLYEDLMMTYNRIVTPTRNASEKLIVRLGLKLSQLMDVNLKNQMMTINLWLNQEWSDYKLEWDPSEYGGITEINLPAEQIWLPDIVLYNSAEGYFAVSIMTKAKVRYDGYVIWNPPAIFRSSCQIDITHFPFDIQNCHLKFGSWTFGDKLDLRHVNETAVSNDKGTDLSEYYQNVEWDIMQASAKRNIILYDCCPEPYYDITFHLKLRRKPLFYTVNLILPCVGITFFSFLVFYLPSDSGEKVTLTISILVSLILFLCVLIETIPSTSLAMPLLGKYLVFTMILITLSVCATVGVLNIHFRTPSTHSMPPWVKRWCMDILPKYLFMSVPQYQQNNILPEQLIYLHNPAYATQAVTLPLKSPSSNAGAQSQTSVPAQQRNGRNNDCCSTTDVSGSAGQNLAKMSHVAQINASHLAQAQPQFQELNVHNLASNPLQAPPATFLPYLQSEAARRLRLQRSRSSEKDNKSDHNQLTTTCNGDGVGASSDVRLNVPHGKPEVFISSQSKSAGEKRKKSKPPTQSLIRRLFNNSKQNLDTESNKEQGPGQQSRKRPSQSSSSRSSPTQHDADDQDEYKHHRHFQARASICSNNLWRIGPTRRCSLAVPMVNYPSYYRPLATLQQHRGSGSGSILNTISGSSALAPIIAHCHLENEDSEETTSSSGGMSNRNRGGMIQSLVARSTNLVQPERTLDQRTELHEMGAITADGFISTGSPMQRGVNAIPPRRPITPTSVRTDSSNTIPTPPPPLLPDFNESSPMTGARSVPASLVRSTIQNQQLRSDPRRPLNFNVRMMNSMDQGRFDQGSSSSATTTIQHPHYAQTGQAFYHHVNMAREMRQTPSSGTPTAQSSCVNQPYPNDSISAGGGDRHVDHTSAMAESEARLMNLQTGSVHQGYYQTAPQQMSKSQSIDHRLSKLAAKPLGSSNIQANVERQNFLNYQTVGGINQHKPQEQYGLLDQDLALQNLRRQQYQSIGRQLGQAYIQRLQRQPAVCSISHQSQTLLPCNRSVQAIAMATSRSGQHLAGFGGNYPPCQALLPGEPSIDMLRRSKSQTSLNKRTVACSAAPNCGHCLVGGAALNGKFVPATNQHRIAVPYNRPQSEMRGRSSPTCCQPNCYDGPAVSYQQGGRFIGEAGQGICQAGARTMPIEKSRGHSINDEENVCRCRALKNSIVVTPRTNQPQRTNQLSTLNLLKLINEVDKAIQNAMFIAQHIDNLDEFESVKENWKYIAMVIDRIFLIVFLFICIVGTVAIFAMVPWTYYLNEKPIDLDLTKFQALNLTIGDTLNHGCP